MEIVWRGNPEMAWPREFRTKCCASVLLIEPDDIKGHRDYAGEHTGYFITCPVCGEQPDIPAAMKHAADRWLRQQERATDGRA